MSDAMNLLNSNQAATYTGTCQFCSLRFVVKHNATRQWHVSKHGYKRPGDGFTIGACPGELEAPYELSKVITVSKLANLNETLATQAASLAELEADKLETLTIEVRRENRQPGETRTVVLTIDRTYDGEYGMNFNHYRISKVGIVRNHIRILTECVAFNTERVTKWKLAPEALRAR